MVRRRRSTYRRSRRRRSTTRRRPRRTQSAPPPYRRRRRSRRRSSYSGGGGGGYGGGGYGGGGYGGGGYSQSAAACNPCGPGYGWPSASPSKGGGMNDWCNPCNPCSPFSIYNMGDNKDSPLSMFKPIEIEMKGKAEGKDELTPFKVDARTLGMYANFYKGCLPCGPC